MAIDVAAGQGRCIM